MVQNHTVGNNIEKKTARIRTTTRRNQSKRRRQRLNRTVTGIRTGIQARVRQLLFRIRNSTGHLTVRNIKAVFERCYRRLMIQLADMIGRTRISSSDSKRPIKFVTKEELAWFGRKQLVTFCSFSAIALAVVISGSSIPVAPTQSAFIMSDALEAQDGTAAQSLTATGDAVQLEQAPAARAVSSVSLLTDFAVPLSCTVSIKDGAKAAVAVTANTDMTVSDVLKQNKITLGADDVLSPSADTRVDAQTEISILRVKYEQVERGEVIPFSTKTTYVQTIPRGESKVLRKGQDGFHTLTVRIRYENGVAVSETDIGEVISEEPVAEEIECGAGGICTDKNGVSYSFSYYIDVIATAYGSYDTRTATGKVPQEDYIAVDPRVIDLGSRVFVAGDDLTAYDGVYYAEDTGAMIVGQRIDIYMGSIIDDIDEMKQFGARDMRVYILD